MQERDMFLHSLYDKGGDSSRVGNFFRSGKVSKMDQSHERGDAGAMQERDMGSHSHLTSIKSDRMQMDIQSEVLCRRFRQPLQSTTHSEMICTNAWSRLQRDLCPGGKDDDCADRDCACRGERVTPPSNGRKERFSSRRIRRGGVHGTTTRLQLEHPSESHMPTQEATLRT